MLLSATMAVSTNCSVTTDLFVFPLLDVGVRFVEGVSGLSARRYDHKRNCKLRLMFELQTQLSVASMCLLYFECPATINICLAQ